LSLDTLPFLALAGSVLVLLVVLLSKNPRGGVLIPVSIAVLLDVLQIGAEGVDVGINVGANDVACGIMLGTAMLVQMRYRKSFPRGAFPCFALVLLVVLNFGRGIGVYGLKAAGNTSRASFWFILPAMAVMLLQPVFRLKADQLARWLAWVAFGLSMIALLRWGGVLPMTEEMDAGFRLVTRTLGADHAMIVGLGLVSAIYLGVVEQGNRWWRRSIWLFGLVTLFLQHRSVWVATATGVAWLMFRTTRLSFGRLVVRAAVIGALLGTAMVIPTQMSKLVGRVVESNVQEAAGEESTWTWRVAGYEEAVTRLFASNPVDILIGPPAGWASDVIGSFASMTIHSRYIQILAYFGITGFIVLLIWFGTLAKSVRCSSRPLQQKPSPRQLHAILLESLLLAELVFMVPYAGGISDGAILGLIWLAAKEKDSCIETASIVEEMAVA
jgi:hypothetical protein